MFETDAGSLVCWISGSLLIRSCDPSAGQCRADGSDHEHDAQAADRIRATFMIPVALDSKGEKYKAGDEVKQP